MRPEDHAVERIDYIESWILSKPNDERQPWLELLEGAYSRYYGKVVTVVFGDKARGEFAIEHKISDSKYVEGYSMRAGSREADYSDFGFLKDLEFHGKMVGIMMQGPSVPFSA